MRLALKFSSPFEAVCSLFSSSLVSFERFGFCSQISTCKSFSNGLLPVLKFSSFFRVVCSCFLRFPNPCRALVERLAPWSQIRKSLSRGLFALRSNPSSPCRAVCSVLKFSRSLCTNSLVFFERFAPFSVPLERFALCSSFPVPCEQIAPVFSNSLVLFEWFATVFSNSLVSFGRFAPVFSSSLVALERFAWSGLLLVLKFPISFERIPPVFSYSLVSFERFAPCSQML